MDINLSSQIVVQTAAQWAVDATVYSNKRILVTSDVYYGSTDQRKFKIADGTQTWAQLDYFPLDVALALTLQQVITNGSSLNGLLAQSNDTFSQVFVEDGDIDLYYNNGVKLGRVLLAAAASYVRHTDKVELDAPTISLPQATASRIVETNASKNLTYAAKNTAYNLNLGTTAGTVLEGNRITQTITNGVTDKAPSEDAVYDALALKLDANNAAVTNSRIQTIYTDITPFTSATTGADELAQSKLIAGGTLTTNDFFDVYNWVSKTGTAGNKTTKVWINTSATLAGATQIAQFENTSTAGSQLFFRTFAIKSNTSIRGLTTGVASAPGFIAVATLGADIAIPTLASDVYIMISVSRTNGADTHISEALKVVPQKAV